jgi:hypothetical protein
MLITNNTALDYYFGPLHLPAGVGQTLTVDDSSATSLYLTDDSVADAINTLAAAPGPPITVSAVTAGILFPRPTGTPEILHGDGAPEGIVYAGQGSMYMSRTAASATNFLFTKTTGVHLNTGWVAINPQAYARHAVRVHQSSGSSIAAATATVVSFDTEDYDSDTLHDNATNPSRITIPSALAGIWLLVGTSQYPNASEAGSWATGIKKNGTTLIASSGVTVGLGASNAILATCSAFDLAAAGDYYEMVTYQYHTPSGGAATLSTPGTSFEASYVSV